MIVNEAASSVHYSMWAVLAQRGAAYPGVPSITAHPDHSGTSVEFATRFPYPVDNFARWKSNAAVILGCTSHSRKARIDFCNSRPIALPKRYISEWSMCTKPVKPSDV